MAIKKSKTLKNGSVGEYWKIITEVYCKISRKGTWTVALFKDQANSNAGHPHLGVTKTYSQVLTPEEMLADRTQVAYAKVKAQASRMVPVLGGKPSDPLVVFDTDLSGGEDI